MLACIQAELMKYRRLFLKKLLWLNPLVAIVLAFILTPMYFTIDAYNWWYMLLQPVIFALIPALMHRQEEGKLHYLAIFSLPVRLDRLWLAKICTAILFLIQTSFLHLLGVFGLQTLMNSQATASYSFLRLLGASVLLLLLNLWQVPLCLFLAKKFGFLVSVVANSGLSLVFSTMLATTSYWLFCPYAWGPRLMLAVLHIQPNGLPVSAADPLLNQTSLLWPSVFSILLFSCLTVLTAKWFSTLEVKA